MANILIVDDDPEVRKFLRRILERAGHEVTEARNGDDGIKQYNENQSDIVILDIVMPGKEGVGTMIDLKKSFPDINIIAISGWNKTFLTTAEQLGAKHTFLKPIGKDEMLAAIEDCLN